MDVGQFVQLLADVSTPVPANLRQDMAHWGSFLCHMAPKLDANARTNLMNVVNHVRKHGRGSKAIMAHCLHFALTGETKSMDKAHKLALQGTGHLAEDIANFNSMASPYRKWDGQDALKAPRMDTEAGFRFWKARARDLRKFLLKNDLALNTVEPVPGRVVIIVQQLIAPTHAPTRSSFEFARKLRDVFGKEVMVVNSMEYGSVAYGSIIPSMTFGHNPILEGMKLVEYRGHHQRTFQGSGVLWSDQSLLECAQAIKDFQPEMILALGTRNLLPEAYADDVFTFIYPTGKGVAHVTDAYFMSWNPLSDTELALCKKRGVRNRYLFDKHPGFEAPPSTESFSRAEFDLPEDKFIYSVVGHRLFLEVDEAFIRELMIPVAKNPDAHFMFVGTFPNYEEVFKDYPELAGRHTYIGFHNDMMAVFALADGYINPIRIGGGSTIVYAMAAGLVALSAAVGDSAEAITDFPQYTTYEELTAEALALLEDEDLRDTYRSLGAATYARLGDRTPLVAKIVDAFEAYQSGSLKPFEAGDET